jgi:hypothetical protein
LRLPQLTKQRTTNNGKNKFEIPKQIIYQITTCDPNRYSYEELQTKPKGVDVLNMEKYLTDADFQKVFGQSRAQFDALPAWKKESLKKSKKLF